jgi:hypothetical protein
MLPWTVTLLSQGVAQDAAKSDVGSIRGTVYDTSGAPYGGALVRARRTDLDPAAAADTRTYAAEASADGVVELTGLPPGIYRVTAVVRDAQMFAKSGVAVEAAKVSGIEVRLEDRYQLGTLGDNQLDVAALDRKAVPPGPAPRTQDGRPDFSGVWAPTSVVDPGKSDMLPGARAAVQKMIEGQGKDTPTARCLPWGAGLDSGSPFKFIQSASVIVILTEDTFSYRQIFLDGRPHPQDGDPTWMGHSIGHWDADTLVIDTTGFNDKAWSPPAGYPHTENLHMIERLRRTDLGHLEIEMTIDDPGTYKQPWTLKRASRLMPGDEIGEYVCAENNQDVLHMVGK